jgi:hypothetical protein
MKKKTTVYIEEDVLKAAKIFAIRRGQKEYEVFEEALRRHLGLEVVGAIRNRNMLSEAAAMALADEEKHASRR